MIAKTVCIHDIFFILVLLLLAFFYVNHNLDYAADDSFITYRYAYNVQHGYGPSFNPGEQFYGSTAMGFAVVLAAMASITDLFVNLNLNDQDTLSIHSNIPHFATILSALSLAITLFVWYKIVSYYINGFFSVVLAILIAIIIFMTEPSNMVSGHETYTFLSLLFLGLYLLVYKEKALLSSLVLFVATTVRPDSFLMFIIAGSWMVLKILVEAN